MIKSPLLRKFLIPMTVAGYCFSVVLYFVSVPYLKNLVYSMEERAVATNLNNVHELVKANYLAIEAYKESVLSSHKRQLRNITLFQEAYIKNKFNLYISGILSLEEAKFSVLEELRSFRYGNNNYVWVADINGVYLSHPDPDMHMADFSETRDVFGNYVLTPLIDQAISKGEGYYSYWWQRLDKDLPAEQLTFGKLFPEWGWVIGTGVYLDDLETEVILRREKMIDELREILLPITIADTGFMYIFDSWGNILIHPEESRVNTNFSSQINPTTQKPLFEDLMETSKSKDHKLVHVWSQPGDETNFIHEKIEWVRYAEGFDWYIVASVYTDELNVSSINLRNKIIILAAGVFVLSVVLLTLLVNKLLGPIRKLSATAEKIEKGDLDAQCTIKTKDEIGFLAGSFNSMVKQLKSHIEDLDQKVLERTKELDEKNEHLEKEVVERKRAQLQVSLANKKLTAWVDKLEQHNREITILNRMGEMLQASDTLEATFTVVSETIAGLFPRAAGALFMLNEENMQMEPKARWGNYPGDVPQFYADECMAVEDGKVHVVEKPGNQKICSHITQKEPFLSLCLPLIGKDEVLGLVHLQYANSIITQSEDETSNILEGRQRLAIAVADQLSLAQANLKLRERLHTLSVRDGLTGLFNRRYLEETLKREFAKAERSGSTTGVIIMDVDFFKKFNDNYGHEAGDLVLIELGKMLCSKVRSADVVCRFGGEEFVIIMPDCPLEQVKTRAEIVRQGVENEMRISYKEHVFKVTISLGVAIYPKHGLDNDQVLKAADTALYEAKEKGRNQVACAP